MAPRLESSIGQSIVLERALPSRIDVVTLVFKHRRERARRSIARIASHGQAFGRPNAASGQRVR